MLKLSTVCEWLTIPGLPAYSFIELTGVCIDTRQLKPGNLFVAIKGDRFDGYDYVREAQALGAQAVVVNRECSLSIPTVVVQDTRHALGVLGKRWAEQWSIPLVAVTGSCGKTTVKEMLAAIFSRCGKTLYPPSSFNNDIGVPLTLLQLTEYHRYGIFECGANHPGEIHYTSRLIQPDVALINNIAPAHLEGFGSLEGVARAKAEIFDGLKPEGIGIIPLDSPWSSLLLESLNDHRRVTIGLSEKCDFQARHIQVKPNGRTEFQLVTPLGSIDIQLGLLGAHNVSNALAASACALCMNVDLEEIQQGLKAVQPMVGRLVERRGRNGVKVIDDTYNANPESVKAALEVLARVSGEKILVLGNLGELGPDAPAYLQALGILAKAKGIDKLYTCGDIASYACQSFGENGKSFLDQESLLAELSQQLTSDTTVLIKGSHAAKMGNIVAGIIQLSTTIASIEG